MWPLLELWLVLRYTIIARANSFPVLYNIRRLAMADTPQTFGDFYNAIAQTKILEGGVWMDEFKRSIRFPSLEEVWRMPLTSDVVVCFAQAIITIIQVRMASICTDALYTSTAKAGHDFLAEISDMATRFGFDMDWIINTPITPTEAIMRPNQTKP